MSVWPTSGHILHGGNGVAAYRSVSTLTLSDIANWLETAGVERKRIFMISKWQNTFSLLIEWGMLEFFRNLLHFVEFYYYYLTFFRRDNLRTTFVCQTLDLLPTFHVNF